MNIWQGNNNEKDVVYPIIVLSVTGRKIDGKSRKSEMNRKSGTANAVFVLMS